MTDTATDEDLDQDDADALDAFARLVRERLDSDEFGSWLD